MTVAVRDLGAVDAPAPAAAATTCIHCGTALAAGLAMGGDGRFCCAGCAAAYALVAELGLGQFYRRRQALADARALRPGADDIHVDFAASVTQDEKGRSTLQLIVDGISCAACVWLIESVLAREPGLVEGRVNMTTRRLTLRWDGPAADANRYAGRVAALGFRLVPFDPRCLSAVSDRRETELLKALAVAGVAAGNVMLLSVSVWAGYFEGMGPATRDLLHWVSALIALPAIAYAGRPFFRSALGALSAGRTNMDVPISIGVLLAAGMSLFETLSSGVHAYFDSAIALLFFLLVGRYLDTRARARARSAAEHLLALGASAVTVLRSDGTATVKAPQAVTKGETVLVAAGERIGVDGTVTDGRSDIDSSLVTGETVPLRAEPGTHVFAGMLNLSAPLRLAVTAVGEGTLLAEIVRLMEAAEQGRGRFVALSDRVARAYAPVVHGLAALTFVGWYFLGGADLRTALLNAIAVLIITCPCALALAVPAVQVVASGRLLRSGILLKSATALERLAAVDTVVFDKTGTLTLGRPVLRPDAARAAADLSLAASIAQSSRHPLARALVRAAPEAAARSGVVEYPGQGLSWDEPEGLVRLGSRAFCGVAADASAAEPGPELWLAVPGRPAVRFAFTDDLRADAGSVVTRLRNGGCDVRLLSGDRALAVVEAARGAGIDQWRSECTPAAKTAELGRLRADGRHVLMVGDGLNDAPALSAADVSASPATAADVSQTAADVVFQGTRLAPVPQLLAVARRAQRVIRENLAFAIVYNVCAVPLAVAGQATPLVAAIAMSTSSLLVIANALRLARGGSGSS